MENTQTSPLNGAVNHLAAELQNQAGEVAARAKDRLGKAYGQAQDKTEETVQNVLSFAKKKPLVALGVAVGAGLLLGALLKSRK